MEQFIAIVKHTAGAVDKFQDFDTQAKADAHVAAYGGYVVGNPGGFPDRWVADGVTLTFDQAAYDADQAMNAWNGAMARSDSGLPRYAEDLYDALNPSDQANASQSTKNKVAAKKALRATKP